MAWLTGFSYRKSHIINAANNAGTNYQVKIVAHYGTGTDNGSDVYLNSHARSDFGDVRFTASDQTTLLDYWMESKTDNDNAVFWVEVSDNLSAGNVTIYIYYGNATATTTSNGDNTFLFFDDFLGTSLDTNKWIEDVYGTGNVTVGSGLLTITETGGGTANVRTIHSKTFTVGTNIAAHTRVREEVVYDSSYGITSPMVGEIDIFPFHTTTQNAQFMLSTAGTSRIIKHQSKFNGTWGTEDTIYSTTPTLNTWYRCKWLKKSTSQSWFWMTDAESVLGSLIGNTDPPQGATSYYLTVGARGMKSSWDWIFVRKYVDPEPAHGSWGSEETSGQQVSKTVIEYLASYDVKGRVASLYRTKMDYVGLSDIKSRVASLYRIFIEYIGLTDKKLKVLSKNFTEYIGIADIKSRIINKYRMITEYLGLLDVKLKTLSKIITENVGLKDVKSRMSSLYRTFNEYVGLLDTKVKTLSKTFSEVLGLIDSVIHQAIFVIYRTVVEYVGLLESKCKTLSKVTTEKIALLDMKSRIASLRRIFIDYVGLLDTKRKSLNKTIIQYVALLESKMKTLSKTIKDYIGLLDASLHNKVIIITRTVMEYLGVKDAYSRIITLFKYIKWRYFQHPKQHVEVES